MSKTRRSPMIIFNTQIKDIDRFNKKIGDVIESKNLSAIKHLKTNVSQAQNKLEESYYDYASTDDFDEDIEYKNYSDAKDKVGDILINIDECLSQLEYQCNSELKGSNNLSIVNLPKFNLPTFSGDLQDWLSFKELFLVSIDRNDSLSEIQKLQYLKISVTGEAARLINGFPISHENYASAWETLVNRYDNKRELAFSQISKILNVRSIKSVRSIRELLDINNESLRNLKTLEFEITPMVELMLIYLIQSKMDPTIRQQWEYCLDNQSVPKYDMLVQFLEKQARSIQDGKEAYKQPEIKPIQKKAIINSAIVKSTKQSCILCGQTHFLFKCHQFIKMTLDQRWDVIKSHRMCINCLRPNHFITQCLVDVHCKVCNKKHHSLLHSFNTQSTSNSVHEMINQQKHKNKTDFTQSDSSSNAKCFSGRIFNEEAQVLLSTAIIKVKDASGRFVECRALLDNGSQTSIISKECCNRLKLPITKSRHSITGINDVVAESTLFKTNLEFTSHFNNEHFNVSALVVNKVTTNLPNFIVPTIKWTHLENLTLADSKFHIPRQVDILLGADIYADILIGQPLFGSPGSPAAINSKIGWLLSGRLFSKSNKPYSICTHHVKLNLDAELKRFWEVESVPQVSPFAEEDEACESYYKNTVERSESGRFIVSLPFREEPLLGESKDQAIKRFFYLESKFERNTELKNQYTEFMKEYETLNHMERIPKEETSSQSNKVYYMPHHGVLREQSETTKLRVVFDASAKTTTGTSLNEFLLTGPKLQQDLFNLLLRFRLHSIALTADIEKMYRQISMRKSDTDFQRIIWRENPQCPLSEFRLLTVTYGSVSSPYLAIRTIQQLAKEEEETFPLASKVLLNDFYVDDMLTGSKSLHEAKKLVTQMTELMESGGFNLRKWASNHPEVLKDLPNESKSTTTATQIVEDKSVKILGLLWNSLQDTLQIQVTNYAQVTTKRHLLSTIAKIFDPLGFISPSTVLLKIMMQDLWKDKLSWDDVIPPSILQIWKKFNENISNLWKIKIQRHLYTFDNEVIDMQLHGFCDASIKAYSAVLYIRVTLNSKEIKVNLIASKTRVAPIIAVSLPRLELCAAVLLARLFKVVTDCLAISFQKTVLWSDSQIVLCWLKSKPVKGNQFVNNRVSLIHSLTQKESWKHVSGSENPADCASRGIMPQNLLNHSLWWKGPHWLSREDPISGEIQENSQLNDLLNLEVEERHCCNYATYTSCLPEFMTKYSSFSKLLRITAWCLRFIKNLRNPSNKTTGFIKATELRSAIQSVVKAIQETEFRKEIHLLKQKKSLPHNSKLLPLNVFLDKEDILRVGGRLSKQSELSEDQKHPMLIPKNSEVTKCIIMYYHLLYLHAGPQLVLALIRQKFWFVNGLSVVKQVLNKCLICFKFKAKPCHQIMGDLPKERITPTKVFSKTGVDFAGPILTKCSHKRSQTKFKSYICLFICMCSKAIHLEPVSDLTTDALLAALRRFIGRRGLPSDIYSDNGTNFKGASNHLNLIHRLCKNQEVQNFCSNHFIQWHFIPPAAPNFGGLWEASIKLTKNHLKKTCLSTLLNFEELSTLLCQIEACVNSRPLTPLSSNTSDFQALTPGHFLIGQPLLDVPEPSGVTQTINLTARWELVQNLKKHFWRRWSTEYLNTLQSRSKWMSSSSDIQVGTLVLIHDNNLPPLQWSLGRITNIFPGTDKRVRVVSIRTKTGEIKRAITKISILPF